MRYTSVKRSYMSLAITESSAMDVETLKGKKADETLPPSVKLMDCVKVLKNSLIATFSNANPLFFCFVVSIGVGRSK